MSTSTAADWRMPIADAGGRAGVPELETALATSASILEQPPMAYAGSVMAHAGPITMAPGRTAVQRDLGERAIILDTSAVLLLHATATRVPEVRLLGLPSSAHVFISHLWPGEVLGVREANLEERSWLGFLAALENEQPELAQAVERVRQFWSDAAVLSSSIALPVTSATDEGLNLAWRTREGKHLELVVTHDGRFDWFFYDAAANVTEGSETPVEHLPPKFWSRAGAFGRAR